MRARIKEILLPGPSLAFGRNQAPGNFLDLRAKQEERSDDAKIGE
jgi:hypothetical protein